MENNLQNNMQNIMPNGVPQKKSHKKFWIIGIAVIAFLLFIIGLGSGNDKKTESPAKEQVQTSGAVSSDNTDDTAQNTDSSSGTLGDYAISILDAEQTKDYNGNPALIINFDYKNNGDDSQMFSTAVSCTAYQNGVELSSAIILNGSYDSDSPLKKIQPGSSLKVQRAFELPDTSSPVTVEVTEFISFNDKKLTKEFTF